MKTLVTQINLYREDTNPFFSPSVTEISIDDEAAGPFIRLTQHTDKTEELRFDFDEIDQLCETLQYFKTLAESCPE